MAMHYVRMFIVGLVVGILARLFYPGAVHMGLLSSAILGIAGSYVAGFIGQVLHPKASSQPFHPAGILYSIAGAMILIFIGRALHLM
jgi:uncharacterized membrane protein YeaQ/YmgE (transglycosylase-associated protein family)